MAFPRDGLRLLLPAVMPSWRFFDAVTASPRIDYALLPDAGSMTPAWHEFRPRPPTMSLAGMLRGFFWNPSWNETLFLVSLAERLLGPATADTLRHSQSELLIRVARDLDRRGLCRPESRLQIRLRLVSRIDTRLNHEIAFLSAPCPVADLLVP